MRLAMFEDNGRTGLAASEGGPFRGAFSGDPRYPGDLEGLLAGGASLIEAGRRLLGEGDELAFNSAGTTKALPPIRRPGKILCVGLNYRAHAAEFGRHDEVRRPEIFARFPSCLIGHEAPIVKPPVSDQLDYEGELAVVIGKAGRNIKRDEALAHVAGYSIFNDVTVRDYQARDRQWTMGKNFDTTGPFGPWLVTPDDLPLGGRGLSLVTRLNGEVMQSSSTDQLISDVPALIEYLSAVMTLTPGDVIITGTPGGVGMGRNPQVFMKAGDVCEVEIEGVGILRNPVIA